ncbi:sulfate transporter CysZ [Gilvimarinus agarilyticus]|uniref:sulfate transporter CysZ n=1 Tax=Gilvimarinus sp. 2_MG-2023 TaxID=3062666 RepID=UPI001C0965B0|nr:sulfate transporter CysZ [Gilvimarinus sp. 2_MG-2023]MBU2885425.1 sulfate transporter CysZ [Gilvimarinus agarilyticus]MDO6570325.1 sulfate transporter CysZ [Gilvimarinus sp. 2_MG-2023]
MQGNPSHALDHLSRGARLMLAPGLKRFIIVPLLTNLLVFIGTTLVLISAFSDFLSLLMGWLPGWLEFLAWLLWAIFAVAVLFIYGYSFNVITNLIAAPFYGILAEKIEQKLTGTAPPEESWAALIPRTLGRELIKLWYFFTRGLLILLLIFVSWFIPGVNLIVLVVSALWAAWCMAVQYVDYPADNHQTPFPELRRRLRHPTLTSYSFGGLIMLASMVPVINIFAMPIAVAGATVFWVTELEAGGKQSNTD